MALQFGGGNVINLGVDSSQLLQTGALQRQQSEQDNRAQAGLMLQELKAEADARGWSVRRMAEMYPDQFRSASSVLFGGGQRGRQAADRMWAETIGGMETETQRVKYEMDRDFYARNPEGTPFLPWEEYYNRETARIEAGLPSQEVEAEQVAAVQEAVEEATPAEGEATTPAPAGPEDPIGAIGRSTPVSTADATLQTLAALGVDTQGAGRIAAPGEAVPRGVLFSDNSYDSPSLAFGQMGLNMNNSRAERELAQRWSTLWSSDELGGDTRQLTRAYLDRVQAEGATTFRERKDIAESMEAPPEAPGHFVNLADYYGRYHRISLAELPVPMKENGFIVPVGADMTEEAPAPPTAPVPGEQQAPTPGPRTQDGQTPGYTTPSRGGAGSIIGNQAARDRMLLEMGSPANQRVQQLTAAQQAQADVARTEATTGLLQAQTSGQYADIELSYQEMGNAIETAGAEGNYGDAETNRARDRWNTFEEAIAPWGLPTAGSGREDIEAWGRTTFKDLADLQEYQGVTAGMRAAIGSSDLLKSQLGLQTVWIRPRWGGRQEEVEIIVPLNRTTAPTGATGPITVNLDLATN